MEDPGFWDNADRANKKMKELKNLKDTVSECNGLKTQYEDIEAMVRDLQEILRIGAEQMMRR